MSPPSATQQKVLRLEQQVSDLLAQVQALQTTVTALQQAQPAACPPPVVPAPAAHP